MSSTLQLQLISKKILLQFILLGVTVFAAPHLFANPPSEEDLDIIKLEVPVGENGSEGRIEVYTATYASDAETPISRRQFGREVARRFRASISRLLGQNEAPYENTYSVGIEDPRDPSLDNNELKEIVEGFNADNGFGDEESFAESMDVETAEEGFGNIEDLPMREQWRQAFQEVRESLPQMKAKTNVTASFVRFVGIGGLFAYTMLHEGANPFQAGMLGLAVGALSHTLQFTSPGYGPLAVMDPYTRFLLRKFGNSPHSEFGILATSIFVKWGLALEGIFLFVAETVRSAVDFGAAGVNHGTILKGVIAVTATQGVAEVVAIKLRKKGYNVSSSMITLMASLTYGFAGGFLVAGNEELSKRIFLGLGIAAWSGLAYVQRGWIQNAIQYYYEFSKRNLSPRTWVERFQALRNGTRRIVDAAKNKCASALSLGPQIDESESSYDPFDESGFDEAS